MIHVGSQPWQAETLVIPTRRGPLLPVAGGICGFARWPDDPVGAATVAFLGIGPGCAIAVRDANGETLAALASSVADQALSWPVYVAGSAKNAVTITITAAGYLIREIAWVSRAGYQVMPVQMAVDPAQWGYPDTDPEPPPPDPEPDPETPTTSALYRFELDRWPLDKAMLIGETVRLNAAVRGMDGQAVDPPALVLLTRVQGSGIRNQWPAEAGKVKAHSPIRDGLGQYHVDLPLTAAGILYYRWQAGFRHGQPQDPCISAAEGRIAVAHGRFRGRA
jgi:hypothetical protein